MKWEAEALLAKHRVELPDSETVKGYVADLRGLLSDSPLAERRAFIRSFVKDVKVTGDDMVLSYVPPLGQGEVKEEKLRVLATVEYGGQ